MIYHIACLFIGSMPFTLNDYLYFLIPRALGHVTFKRNVPCPKLDTTDTNPSHQELVVSKFSHAA